MTSLIFVRTTGEADIALSGPENELLYLSALPGSPWTSSQVAPAGTTGSYPSIFVRPDGEADIVVQGTDQSLLYYWGKPGGPWSSVKIAAAGTTFSAPSIFVRPDGEADVVVQGPDNSLLYYWAIPGGTWSSFRVAGAGTTFGIPSIFVRPDGEADVVVQGPDNSLLYYWAIPGGTWSSFQVAGAGTTFGDPSIFVRPNGEADIAAQGSGQSLLYYWKPGPPPAPEKGTVLPVAERVARPMADPATTAPAPAAAATAILPEPIRPLNPPQGNPWNKFEVAPAGTTTGSPSIFVRPDGEADIVAIGPALSYYWAVPGGTWQSSKITADFATILASNVGGNPSLAVRPDGQADVVVMQEHWTPMCYSAMPGSNWSGTRLAQVYNLSVPRLTISTMRTGHLGVKVGTDTDYASLSVQVKGYPIQTVTASVGSHDSGTLNVGLASSVIAAAGDLVILQYNVVNSHNDPSDVNNFLEQTGTDICEAVIKADGAALQDFTGISLPNLSTQEQGALIGAQIGNVVLPGFGGILGAVAGWFSSNIADFAWPDCDGPVAVGLHVWSGAQAQALASANNGSGTSGDDDNPGTASQHGCGSNSDYQVSWSIAGE